MGFIFEIIKFLCVYEYLCLFRYTCLYRCWRSVLGVVPQEPSILFFEASVTSLELAN